MRDIQQLFEVVRVCAATIICKRIEGVSETCLAYRLE